MCTYITETLVLEGSAKGANSWFKPKLASIYFDHPAHAPFDHSLNIDVFNQEGDPSSRVALELSRESALALAQSILSVIATADADMARMAAG